MRLNQYIWTRKTLFLLLVFALVLLFIWAGGLGTVPGTARFAVISDPHVYDPRLGTTGSEFERHLAQDVKMVVESGALFERTLVLLAAHEPKPSFLLISGDLTHDGEAASHLLMASYLAGLRAKGIQPYVIPGNHDIDNPSASRYDPHGKHPAQRISADVFADIYAPFGYRQAIARDPRSLSYIAEPVPGYWLFAIDSCRYTEENKVRLDAGRLRPETLNWILSKLEDARRLGKQTLGMTHHSMLEHSLAQARYFPDFVLEDWEIIGQKLAKSGLKLIFTGHSHSQNITRKTWNENQALLDVQTGSLVTYPNPVRYATLDAKNSTLSIRSEKIMRLTNMPTLDAPSFSEPSRQFASDRQFAIVSREMSERSSLPRSRQVELSQQIVTAILASYAGDERPTLRAFNAALKLRNSPLPDETAIGNLTLSLWHDLPPDDNNIDLKLEDLAASGNELRSLGMKRQAAR